MTELESYQPNRPAWLDELEPAWNLAKRLERAPEFVPNGFANRAEAIMAAILTGAELGHGPMWSLRNIVVINGRTSLYAEAQRASSSPPATRFGRPTCPTIPSPWQAAARQLDHTTTVTSTSRASTEPRLAQKQTWEGLPRPMLDARPPRRLSGSSSPTSSRP